MRCYGGLLIREGGSVYTLDYRVTLVETAGRQNMHDNKRNRIYNRILDRDWLSARLFVI